MCGIVGYLGNKEKKEIILNGLKELEYRGYDSAGLAVLKDDEFSIFKADGKIKNLEKKCENFSSENFGLAIGHTRWATHGKPSETNAHPHYGEFSALVHNGIIENFSELKEKLQHCSFKSETDTETIIHLFEEHSKNSKSAFEAFEKTIKELRGSFAILLITKLEPNKIFFAKNKAPLALAQNEDEVYFASSETPLIGLVKSAAFLDDEVYGYASSEEVKFFKAGEEVSQTSTEIASDRSLSQKNGFRFFMEKEIYEQSSVAIDVMMGRISEAGINFSEIDTSLFDGIEELIFCACGTSYHAALTASYLCERMAKIRTKVEIASEFRYREPYLSEKSLFIVISQSGETADTLEALKLAKEKGLKTLAFCNVDNSSITRLADFTILIRAGIEKGVASTKAFMAQVMLLWMFVLYLAQFRKTIKEEELKKELAALLKIPQLVEVDKKVHEKLKRIAKHYLKGHGFFFIGRDVFYPLALEGALKLKEITYLHAEGYAAGEMRHGPIALADEDLFTISLLPKNICYEKAFSNTLELAARDSFIFAISPKEFELSDDYLQTSQQEHYMCEYFEMMVITQLFALEIAIRMQKDADMPRNLAKSVTVE